MKLPFMPRKKNILILYKNQIDLDIKDSTYEMERGKMKEIIKVELK